MFMVQTEVPMSMVQTEVPMFMVQTEVPMSMYKLRSQCLCTNRGPNVYGTN